MTEGVSFRNSKYMVNVSELKFKNFSWVNTTRAAKAQMDFLAKKYNLLNEDVLDVLPPTQTSKLVERPNYLFMILLLPVYHREEKHIRTEEVNFFIAENLLITIHNDKIPVMKNVLDGCRKNSKQCVNIVYALYAVLESLLNYCYPLLRHINEDMEKVEAKLFKQFEKKETVEEILRIKTNIFDFERAVASHEYILNKLAGTAIRFFPTGELEKNFVNLVEIAKEIRLSLTGHKDMINSLHETNATLVEYRVNQIIKTLTVFAVITFPLTLVAALFSMQTDATPIVGTPFDFWKITGAIIAAALVMLGIFRWRRWI